LGKRYHTTAVETGKHLLRYLTYIDLNMVRIGKVTYSRDWMFGGYNEICSPRRKYGIISHERLVQLPGCDTYDNFKQLYKRRIDLALESGSNERDNQWSRSLAVGEEAFVIQIKKRLGARASGRKIKDTENGYEIREDIKCYLAVFDAKKDHIGPENSVKPDELYIISYC
jgi:putative transposase